MSFFVDGFRAAKWLRDNEAAAFHILTATPVRFQINVNGVLVLYLSKYEN